MKRLFILVMIVATAATACKKETTCWECTDNTGSSFEKQKKCGWSESDIRAWEQANNWTCVLK